MQVAIVAAKFSIRRRDDGCHADRSSGLRSWLGILSGLRAGPWCDHGLLSFLIVTATIGDVATATMQPTYLLPQSAAAGSRLHPNCDAAVSDQHMLYVPLARQTRKSKLTGSACPQQIQRRVPSQSHPVPGCQNRATDGYRNDRWASTWNAPTGQLRTREAEMQYTSAWRARGLRSLRKYAQGAERERETHVAFSWSRSADEPSPNPAHPRHGCQRRFRGTGIELPNTPAATADTDLDSCPLILFGNIEINGWSPFQGLTAWPAAIRTLAGSLDASVEQPPSGRTR